MAINSKAKVALLNSPYILNEPFFQHSPPLSILYLASYMEKNGFEPRLFNLDRDIEDKGIYYFGFDVPNLIKDLADFQPHLIGITCAYSSRWPFTLRLTGLIKSTFPDIPIVLGGIHPTTFPEYCLSSSDADYVIIGEGEVTTIDLFKHILSGTKPYEVDGIVFKDGNKIFHNPKKQFISNLDEIPFPAYHYMDIEKLKKICKEDKLSYLKGFYFSILTSRSCPNQCTYCNMHLVHGRGWRPRSPDNVLSEIAYLVDKYKVRQFAIVDDNFSLLRNRTLSILKGIINLNMGIQFIAPNGLSINTLDDEVIWHFKRAGAKDISIAIESGSEYIRNTVYNKRLNTEQIYKVVGSCRKHKLPCKAFFMVGAPGESDETVNQSIELMRKIKLLADINITTPYKGTELYNYYIENNIIQEDDSKKGYLIDIRLPVEKMKDYNKIISWRRKMQFFNILYSLPQIFRNHIYLSINSLKRLIFGTIIPKKLTSECINSILNRYLPL